MKIERKGRLAGIDFGTVRIGIAVTDVAQRIATPYETYRRSGLDADARRFQRLVAEEDIARFVVGLPVHTSGEESIKSREAREFGAWLRDATGVPVVFFDERFTSRAALRLLEGTGLSAKKRKEKLDMLAAQVMLSAYLESEGNANGPPGALDDDS